MFIYDCRWEGGGGKEETSFIVLRRIHMNTSWYHINSRGRK